MTREEFIQALKVQTSDSAVDGTKRNLERPAGRKPRKADVELSEWYRSLSEADQVRVLQAVQEAAELAVFSFLCVLDGVSAIEDGPDKGELKLYYSKGEQSVLLNDESSDYLHDLYNELCQGSVPKLPNRSEGRVYEVGTQPQLRERQTARDALDLHVVSEQETGNDDGAPAIALPKYEHRKLDFSRGKPSGGG
jgi:hypothetical protein